MKLIPFPEQTVTIAKDQPEYEPLPAFQFAHDRTNRITCCWQLTIRERLRLLFTGKLWHTVMTFGQPLQPQLLQLEKPFTPADVIARRKINDQIEAERALTETLVKKYGETARKKTQHMDALNYHPNDRRRTIKLDPEDFAAAQKLGILHLFGCRIVEDRGCVAATSRSTPKN